MSRQSRRPGIDLLLIVSRPIRLWTRVSLSRVTFEKMVKEYYIYKEHNDGTK